MSTSETEFAEFFRAGWAPCLRAVAASTGDVQLAEEQVAEAFARAWASWRKVRRHPAPRAWVLRTALNLGVSRWRRFGRELPLSDFDFAVPGTEVAGLDGDVFGALRRLPDRQREVVVLRVLLDLDVASTASYLEIAPGTVRAHLSRATAALRAALDEANSQEESKCPTPTS